ncbi:MAG TPA: ATP-binding protein [Candidatus Elarobacter sp.]|nr:ATP-binding protein [Candidatus Elarobacter sp.]
MSGVPPRRRWSLSGDPAGAARARTSFRDEIARHAGPDSDLEGAELIFAELLSNVVRHAHAPATASLRWTRSRVTLLVLDLGGGFRTPPCRALPEPTAETGRGLALVDALARRVRAGNRSGGGAYVCAVLPVHLFTPAAALV